MFKGNFEDIVISKNGFLRGPFGGDLKKSIFVPKSDNTYKVYEQGVVLQSDATVGNYYISKQYFDDKMNKFEVKTGDFLVSCSGVNYGAIFQLPENIEQGVINQALLRIRVNEELVNPDYFYYYYTSYIKRVITGGTGDSTIPNFPPMSIIKSISIELPDLFKQKRIAKMLSSIDKKIKSNNSINKELDSMAKTIYDYWFLQFEFPNEEGKPYKSSGGKMVWNEELKREVPEGWSIEGVEHFGTLQNGINYDKGVLGNKEYKIVNIKNISATTLILNINDLDKICLQSKTADKYIVKENNILIARSGIPGAIRVLKADSDNTIFCGFIICLSLKNNFYKNYLVYQLKDYENTSATTSGGTIMQNVSQDTLKRLRFLVPDEDIVSKFNKQIDSIWSLIQKSIKENNELISLRDFLLPLLMNGQVGFRDDINEKIEHKEVEEREFSHI